jgi:hypothetical protein|tara:strand:- start:2467 stop:2622 length:156 start_codon:yes stop_codon:yes gene_type:complete
MEAETIPHENKRMAAHLKIRKNKENWGNKRIKGVSIPCAYEIEPLKLRQRK